MKYDIKASNPYMNLPAKLRNMTHAIVGGFQGSFLSSLPCLLLRGNYRPAIWFIIIPFPFKISLHIFVPLASILSNLL